MGEQTTFKSGWSFLWALLGKWWSLMYGFFGLYASIDLAIHKMASFGYQEWWDSNPVFGKFDWKESLIVGLVIAMAVVARHAWTIVQGLQDRIDKISSDGPDVRLVYDNHSFGGFLAVQNFGPGMIYNVAVEGISNGQFVARCEPINSIEAKCQGQSDGIMRFTSDDNTATKRQLIDAISQTPESDNFDWSKVIPVTLSFDWKNLRRTYRYDLECWPFRKKVEFRRRMG